MSHISVLKTLFADRDLLIEALKELGYTLTEGEGLTVTDGVKNCPVDFLAELPYSAPIGFKKTKNGWQAAADWFRVLEKRKTVEDQIRQTYARLSVYRTMEEQGFQSVSEEKDERGRIRLVLRRVA